MLARLRPHLKSPAVWLSLLALFIALDGPAYAIGKITGKQVVNNSLTGADIKNGSIGLADLSTAAKNAVSAKIGPAGPAGPAGAPGAAGPAGPAGTNGSAIAYGQLAGVDGDCAITNAFRTAATCTQPVTGTYEVDVTGGTDISQHVGTCTFRGNGGTPVDRVKFCFLRIVDANTVRVESFVFDATGGVGAKTVPAVSSIGVWFAVY